MALSCWLLGTGTVDVGLSTTIVITITGTAAVGDLVSGWAVCQSNGTVNSVSDTGGNTWTIRSAFVSGTAKYYWIDSILTTALGTSDTISVVCSTAANRKLAVFQGISGFDPSPFDQQGAGVAGTTTAPSITTGTPAQADSIILAGIYSGLRAISAEDSDYTTIGEAIISSRYMHTAYRVISSAAADTYAPTVNDPQSWDMNYIIYKGASSPPASTSRRNIPLLGVG